MHNLMGATYFFCCLFLKLIQSFTENDVVFQRISYASQFLSYLNSIKSIWNKQKH